jgi:molybdopterin-guanine dinucleotide biosynthesis protein A
MGQDKAFLPWGPENTPLWLVQLRKLHRLQPAHLRLSSRSGQTFPASILDSLQADIVPDPHPDRGPLAALVTCPTDFMLPLAVDMPDVTSQLLQELITQADPRRGLVFHEPVRDRYQPFPAIYPRRIASLAQDRLDRGRLSLQGLIKGAVSDGILQAQTLDARHAALFKNINAPEDIDASTPPPASR